MAKLILITGGSASGKTTVAESIKEALGNDAVLISQDNFYKAIGSQDTNYDVPEAFDFELQDEILTKLFNDEEIDLPTYDFAKHSRTGSVKVKPKEYIVFEGLFTLRSKSLCDKSLFKIFVDTPADTRLARRAKRDVSQRGRKLDDVLDR